MSAKVHALVVCPCGCGVRTACGRGRDGTFLYRGNGRPLPKGARRVPLTCKSCRRIVGRGR